METISDIIDTDDHSSDFGDIDKGYRMWRLTRSYLDTMTVHAPQPPDPQPNFAPVSRTGAKG